MGFDRQNSGVGSKCSANCATSMAHLKSDMINWIFDCMTEFGFDKNLSPWNQKWDLRKRNRIKQNDFLKVQDCNFFHICNHRRLIFHSCREKIRVGVVGTWGGGGGGLSSLHLLIAVECQFDFFVRFFCPKFESFRRKFLFLWPQSLKYQC